MGPISKSNVCSFLPEYRDISISVLISFCDSVIFPKFRRNIEKHRYFGLKIKNTNFFLFFKFFLFFSYDEDPLYQWVRPTHLDDDEGNPNPRVATRARDFE